MTHRRRRTLVGTGAATLIGAGTLGLVRTAAAQPPRTTAASLAGGPRRENIIPPDMQNLYDRFHYAPAVRIHDVLYVSGQVGRDESLKVVEDPEAQMIQASTPGIMCEIKVTAMYS